MWSFSGGVTLKCCSSIKKTTPNNKYKTSLLSNNFYVKIIPISCSTNISKKNFNIHNNKSFIVYKMAMGIYFTNLKKS